MNKRIMRELSRPDMIFQTAVFAFRNRIAILYNSQVNQKLTNKYKGQTYNYLTKIKKAWSFSLFQDCEYAKIHPSIQQIFIVDI